MCIYTNIHPTQIYIHPMYRVFNLNKINISYISNYIFFTHAILLIYSDTHSILYTFYK